MIARGGKIMKYLYTAKKENRSRIFFVVGLGLILFFYYQIYRIAVTFLPSYKLLMGLLFIIIFLIMVVPLLVYPSWHVTKTTFVINNPIGVIQKWKYIFDKKCNYNILYKDIKKIIISYTRTSSTYIYQKGYVLTFQIVLLDHNSMTMDALLNKDTQNFLNAIHFIKQSGVMIEDKYDFLTVLTNDNNIYSYIKKLEDANYD
jgi:hypothetical protein